MSLVRNTELLIEQLAKWPLLTILIGGVYVVANLIGLARLGSYTPFEFVIAAFASASGVAFLKASLLFLAYPLIYRRRFQGSYLIIALLVTALLVNWMGALSYLVLSREADVPGDALPWFLGGTFVVFSAALWAAFRVVNWLYGLRDELRSDVP